MKIKEITFYKEYKKGLPNYSSICAGFGMTIELDGNEANEEVAKVADKSWKVVNKEVMENAAIEEAWLEHLEEKKNKYVPRKG